MKTNKLRIAALLLTAALLCAACGASSSPASSSSVSASSEGLSSFTELPLDRLPDGSVGTDSAPSDTSADPRREALLETLDDLLADDILYARLCDLNGDDEDDLLLFGRHQFSYGGQNTLLDCCFIGCVWDGAKVDVIPFDKAEYLALFGSGRYAVYREKSTGMYYAAYSFAMDDTVKYTFQNAADCVELGYRYDYETEQGRAEGEQKAAELQAEIDGQFELVEELVFPKGANDVDGAYLWSSFWNGHGARPELPDFYATVGRVQRALAGEDGVIDPLPFAPDSIELMFSLGTSGWGNTITLNPDGSFSGRYSDTDAGENGYQKVVYLCEYSGRFGGIRKVNDHTWLLMLESVETRQKPGDEWAEGDTLYRGYGPYGLETGSDFLLYTPDAPTGKLPEEFLDWWSVLEDPPGETLGRYGLYNVQKSYGFFS